jgi:hypothetical protein
MWRWLCSKSCVDSYAEPEEMPTTVDAIQEKLTSLTQGLEAQLSADVLGIFGPILSGVEHRVRAAIEKLSTRRTKLAVVLQTGGGSIEVSERIVSTIRQHFNEIVFLIPDVALSAGTILVMSGDAIMMDYFSCLGPIDPQVERNGKLVPALSYLEQFNRLVAKSSQGMLTTAELALLNKLDLAELHTFEQAANLSVDLLVQWLTTYKFKDWTSTATRRIPVTPAMRENRAREIAVALNDHRRWRSHGRGIAMRTLTQELNLVVDDFGSQPVLAMALRDYSAFVNNCMVRENLSSFVTSREYC